tara:strand:+ start:367 stop:552 length:186 start_codon:yes stop_codon:yes gene_type:complete
MDINPQIMNKIKSSTLWYFSSFGFFIAFSISNSEKHLFKMALVTLTISASLAKKERNSNHD